jgi:3-hydroxyacyl-CoA dehydrogenase
MAERNTFCTELSDPADRDLIVEAIGVDLEAKVHLFRRLDEVRAAKQLDLRWYPSDEVA